MIFNNFNMRWVILFSLVFLEVPLTYGDGADEMTLAEFQDKCITFDYLSDKDKNDIKEIVDNFNKKALAPKKGKTANYPKLCTKVIAELLPYGEDIPMKELREIYEVMSVKRIFDTLGDVNQYFSKYGRGKMGCSDYKDSENLKLIKNQSNLGGDLSDLFKEDGFLAGIDIDNLRQPEIRSLLGDRAFVERIVNIINALQILIKSPTGLQNFKESIKNDEKKLGVLGHSLVQLKIFESLLLTNEKTKDFRGLSQERLAIGVFSDTIPGLGHLIGALERVNFETDDKFNKLLSIQIAKKNRTSNREVFLTPEERKDIRSLFRAHYTGELTEEDFYEKLRQMYEGNYDEFVEKIRIIKLATEGDNFFIDGVELSGETTTVVTSEEDVRRLLPPPPVNRPDRQEVRRGVGVDQEVHKGREVERTNGGNRLILTREGGDSGDEVVPPMPPRPPAPPPIEDSIDENPIVEEPEDDLTLVIDFDKDKLEEQLKMCDELNANHIVYGTQRFLCLAQIKDYLNNRFLFPEPEDEARKIVEEAKEKVKDELRQELVAVAKTGLYGSYNYCLNNYSGEKFEKSKKSQNKKKTKAYLAHEDQCEKILSSAMGTRLLGIEGNEFEGKGGFRSIKPKKKVKCSDFQHAGVFIPEEYRKYLQDLIDGCQKKKKLEKKYVRRIGNLILLSHYGEILKLGSDSKADIDIKLGMARDRLNDEVEEGGGDRDMILYNLLKGINASNTRKDPKGNSPVPLVRSIGYALSPSKEDFFNLIFEKYSVMNKGIPIGDDSKKLVKDIYLDKVDDCGKKKDEDNEDSSVVYSGVNCPKFENEIMNVIRLELKAQEIAKEIQEKFKEGNASVEEKVIFLNRYRKLIPEILKLKLLPEPLKEKCRGLKQEFMQLKENLDQDIKKAKVGDFKMAPNLTTNTYGVDCEFPTEDGKKGRLLVNLANTKNGKQLEYNLAQFNMGKKVKREKNEKLFNLTISSFQVMNLYCQNLPQVFDCFETEKGLLALEAQNLETQRLFNLYYKSLDSGEKLYKSDKVFLGEEKSFRTFLNSLKISCQ